MKGVAQDPARMMGQLASASGNISRAATPGVHVDALLPQIKSAKQRFAHEDSLAPSPAPQTNRATLTMTCTENRRSLDQTEQRGHPTFRTSYKGVQAHVSIEPLEALRPMLLSEMLLRKTYKGHYILCRIFTVTVRMVDVMFGVEDVAGNVVQLTLNNYPGTAGATGLAVDALFPIGAVLAVREPTLKMMAQGNEAHIRVDCPSDIVRIDDDHSLLKDVNWKTGQRLASTPTLPRTEEEWREMGNRYFKSGWFVQAVLAYSRGLRRYPTSILLYLDRSLAHLHLNYYGAALADALRVAEDTGVNQPTKVKAIFRAGQAKYGMGLWDDAQALFKQTSELDKSEVDNCQTWIERCRDRTAEARDGSYDWTRLFDLANIPGQRLDVADFTGPVEVAEIPSRGGGRGVVATRDIKCGELLVVSKAFACCFPEDHPSRETLIHLNLLQERIESSCSAYLGTMISERLAGDPGSASLLYGLYAGPQNPAPPREYTVHRTIEKNMIDNYLTFETVVDMPRIDVITSYNSFVPSPPSGVEEVEKSPEGAGGYTNTASALFTLPSLFNHSCAPNTHIFCLGDVMVVRAASHIAKDTELFICYDPQGETYISRNKSGVVARLVPNCDCILCLLDKADGEVACRKREEIVKGIPSWNSVEIAHAGIRKLEKTYNKGTPMGMRGAMFKATWQLATLLLEKKDHAGFLQQGLKMLDYLGMKMRSMEHGAKSKRHARRNSLPVERTSVNPISASISWDNIIIACLFMADALIHPLENRERAETWLRFAVWLHDTRWGGGSALFLRWNPFSSIEVETLFQQLEREGRLLISC
ncbi:hypothetical protein FRB95_009542 [Tulasnella sp. JGI-2019a]|nr:hypothetical protein FRB93_005571 [Tulasnella sp. JGI-2019a]KAG9025956.1 hypothetical protein FRB95_009542 [Tulasnella sp. JGI-2019a]